MREKYGKVWTGLFCLVTLVCIYFRVFYGWDHDESYNILLAQRIADGKIIFKDMWDLHQTAAIFPALFIKIFMTVTGSTSGLAVFLRSISAVVQVLLALYSYKVFKKYYGQKCAFGAAIVVANLLPRATQELEYSTISIWGCLVCGLLLLEISKEGISYKKLIFAGVFYAAAVYSYPTILITALFVAFLIIFVVFDDRKVGVKSALVFFLTCVLVAGALAVYLFTHMTVSEFVQIIHELGKNGDHTVWFGAFFSLDYIKKSGVRLIGMIAIAVVLRLFAKYVLKSEIKSVYFFVFITTLIVVLLNLTGLRPSGPFGLLERYIGAVILFFFMGLKDEDRVFTWIFGGLGIALYLGVLMGSNLGFNENAMYLEMSMICLVVLAIKYLENMSYRDKRLGTICVWTFIAGIIFSSGYFVRIDGTQPANVFQCTETMDYGPLNGIKVFPEKKKALDEQSSSLYSMTDAGKLYTVLTREPIGYYFVKGDYISAQYAATAQYYNEQWVDFYTLYGRKLPDEILISKEDIDSLDKFYEKEFGQWVKGVYIEDKVLENSNFWVFVQR